MNQRWLVSASVVLVVASIWSGAAQAQRYHIFSDLPTMTKQDMALLTDAGRAGMDDQEIGTRVEWRNDKSGHRGEVTLLNLYERAGQECRHLKHEVWENAFSSQTMQSKICLQPDGSWKIPPD